MTGPPEQASLQKEDGELFLPQKLACCVDHVLLPAANTLLAATAMVGNNLLTPAQSNSSEALSQLSSVTLP